MKEDIIFARNNAAGTRIHDITSTELSKKPISLRIKNMDWLSAIEASCNPPIFRATLENIMNVFGVSMDSKLHAEAIEGILGTEDNKEKLREALQEPDPTKTAKLEAYAAQPQLPNDLKKYFNSFQGQERELRIATSKLIMENLSAPYTRAFRNGIIQGTVVASSAKHLIGTAYHGARFNIAATDATIKLFTAAEAIA